MIRILAIAPYSNLKIKMDEIAQSFKTLYIESYTGDLSAGLEIARKKSANFDIIVSRGGTAKLIAKNFDKPLIEIDLSLLDILRVIRLVDVYKYHCAFIGFSNVTDKIKLLGQILEKELHVITISKSAELPSIINELKDQGYTMIIGDNVTFKEARKSSLNSILIESGNESIQNAFSAAQYLGTELQKKANQNKIVTEALNAFEQSVLVLDRSTQVCCRYNNKLRKSQEQAILRNMKPKMASGSTEAFTIFVRVEQRLFRVNARFRDNLWYVLLKSIKFTSKSRDTFSIQSFTPSSSNQDVSSVNMGNLAKNVEQAAQSKKNILLIGEKGTAKLAAAEHLASMISADRYWKIDLSTMKSDSVYWALFNDDTSPLLDHHALFIINHVELLNMASLKSLHNFCAMSAMTDNHFLLICQSNPHQIEIAKQFHEIFHIVTVPLRKRVDDLGSLVSLYLYHFSQKHRKNVVGISEDGMSILESYSWPENLSQFKRVLEQLVLRANGSFISNESVKQIILAEESLHAYHHSDQVGANISMFKGETLAEIEKQISSVILKHNSNNRTKTAKQLGISRSTLWRILK